MNDIHHATGDSDRWYAVRSFFNWPGLGAYEERITLWRAANAQEAIAKAEAEGDEYCERGRAHEMRRLPDAQAFLLAEPPREGGEAFSLLRNSEQLPDEYVKNFFITGNERSS